jgi:hypothetical protein
MASAPQAGEASLQPMAQALCLNGMKIHLGPELRAMFPVVLNMGISGDIELNGAASPESLKVAGTIYLDGGEVSLSPTGRHCRCAFAAPSLQPSLLSAVLLSCSSGFKPPGVALNDKALLGDLPSWLLDVSFGAYLSGL